MYLVILVMVIGILKGVYKMLEISETDLQNEEKLNELIEGGELFYACEVLSTDKGLNGEDDNIWCNRN